MIVSHITKKQINVTYTLCYIKNTLKRVDKIQKKKCCCCWFRSGLMFSDGGIGAFSCLTGNGGFGLVKFINAFAVVFTFLFNSSTLLTIRAHGARWKNLALFLRVSSIFQQKASLFG